MGRLVEFFRKTLGPGQVPAPSVPLDVNAYVRSSQDQQNRLSLQRLTAQQITTASSSFTQGDPSPMGDIADSFIQTDPEIKAALKQLKTAVAGVEFVVTAANDSTNAQAQAKELRTDLDRPSLNLRGLKGWIVEGRVRGIGLIESVWNDPTEPHRTWKKFKAIPQQRTRLNRVTGEAQFASTPYTFQGTDVSSYEKGKWIVIQPDEHIQDYALRGILPALLNDGYGRLDAMGWWNMCLERDAMKMLVGKAGNDADALALDFAFKNRGAAGAFLIRDPNSSVSQLEGTLSRSGVSPYAEYMVVTGQRIALAILGESQTMIIPKDAGSKQSADTHAEVARYVVEDVCNDVSFIVQRDMIAPWSELNYGPQNAKNAPLYLPRLEEHVDVVALNQAISTRPANVKLGVPWYRQETGWVEPPPGDELLAEPMPMPGQAPVGMSPAVPKPGDKMPMDPTMPNGPAKPMKKAGAV